MLHNSFYVIEKLSPDYIVMSALWKKYAVGSAFIIRSELFDDEKMFDERYFVYWEEVGLSLKIINQGYKICVLNNSVCIWDENSQVHQFKAQYYLARNSFLINKKYHITTCPQVFSYYSKSLLKNVYNALRYKKPAPLSYFVHGILDGIRGKYGLMNNWLDLLCSSETTEI